jgi:UDP-N-acetylglucosamine 2-epimerase (non-hydrolysing)
VAKAPRHVLAVVGARPNFMKVSPVLKALAPHTDAIRTCLVHTGQHYDERMSDVFLRQLQLGAPAHFLGVGSGSHAQQTARVLERLEPILHRERPDLVLVAGDVNSTLATTLAAVQAGIPVAHLEAGLRSFDRTMPEEVNRVVTDAISSLLLIPSRDARANLLREGAEDAAIHFVGNTMIDTLFAARDRPDVRDAPARLGLEERRYLLVTLHRPALVDGPLLAEAIEHLGTVARALPVVFPVHPRTAAALDERGLEIPDGVRLLPPLDYLDFLGLMRAAAGVLTDSGGVQEETTVLGVPCFTLRANTERPVTIEQGTNTLLGLEPAGILGIPDRIAAADRSPRLPEHWDGRAAERVVEAIRTFLDCG